MEAKTKVVRMDDKKELKKQEERLKKRREEAIKAIKKGKGFILLNLTDKGIETFLSAGFKPREVLTAIGIMERISLDLVMGLKDVPCDCPNCTNKFSGVN